MTIKIKLNEMMKIKGLTYRDLAEKALGDSRRAPELHRVATGQTDPRVSMIDRLISVLGCKLTDLLEHKKK